MKKHLHKIKSHIIAHKIISGIVIIAILGGGYFGYKKYTSTAGETRYITSAVKKGTIVVSISGSGQVSALNQIDIKAKASGDVVYLPKKSGDVVSQGALIAQLDTSLAQKAVRDAEINLESTKIALEKLKIEKSQENLNSDLAKSYDDGFNAVSNVFLDLPTIMSGLDDMFFKATNTSGQWNIDWYEGQVRNDDLDKVKIFKNNFVGAYGSARAAYDSSFENYKSVSRNSPTAEIEALILKTYETTKLVSDAVKSANNFLDFVDDSIQRDDRVTPALMTTHKASLSTYTTDANSALTNLLAIKTSIKSYQDAFLNSDLDIRTSSLSVTEKENALADAKDKLADYFIRAPFAGTLATVNIKKSDSVSTGATTGTLITKSKIAELSLNEVDVAKIKVGEKTTLTFDAVPDLTISGLVAQIDAVGTVSQGVVTYIVKVNFDTEDDRVKPGMSVNGNIVTDTKENVLVVPNSAIKSQGGSSYVEMFNTPLARPTDGSFGSISKIKPNRIPVEIGLSSDKETEIISGIKEGDEIVVRTIQGTATTTSAPSIFGSSTPANRNGNTGGAVRVQAR